MYQILKIKNISSMSSNHRMLFQGKNNFLIIDGRNWIWINKRESCRGS